MAKTLLVLNRDDFLFELRTLFDERNAEIMLGILDKVAVHIQREGVSRDDFIELKRLVEELSEKHDQLAEEFHRFAETNRIEMQELRDIIANLSCRMDQLSGDIDQLKTDVAELKTDVAQLKTDVAELKTDVAVLKTDVAELKTDVGHLKGDMLEVKFKEKAPSYFGRLLRKSKVVDVNILWDTLERYLSSEEIDQVLLLDLIVRGKDRSNEIEGDIFLAVEISSVVDKNDVFRARQRADFLKKAGYRTIPLVAGQKMTAGVEQNASSQGVVVLVEGQCLFKQEAFALLDNA